MGASAFIMAETTGVSYGTIAVSGGLPALLYYLGVMAQVHFRAGRDHLKGVPRTTTSQRSPERTRTFIISNRCFGILLFQSIPGVMPLFIQFC